MIDIEKMTSGEWLAYREQKVDDFYARGNKLIPDPECGSCDVANNYVCFDCECFQLEKEHIND